MLNCRELNLELTKKLKNFEDVQNFKRPAPKRTLSISSTGSDIEFTSPDLNTSKKAKQVSEKPILKRRDKRIDSTGSDFSFDDESSPLSTISVSFLF